MSVHSTTDDVRPVHRAWLVRSDATGEILHVHQEISFDDRSPDGKTGAQRAGELAADVAELRETAFRVEAVDPGDIPVTEFRRPRPAAG